MVRRCGLNRPTGVCIVSIEHVSKLKLNKPIRMRYSVAVRDIKRILRCYYRFFKMHDILEVNQLIELHDLWTAAWHAEPGVDLDDVPWSMIQQNHRMNFEVWHCEDAARRDDLGSDAVRVAKRRIDR